MEAIIKANGCKI